MNDDVREKKMKTTEVRRPRICCEREVALQLDKQLSWWWEIILQRCKKKETLKKKVAVKKKEDHISFFQFCVPVYARVLLESCDIEYLGFF